MSLVKDIYYTACSALPMQLLKKVAPSTTLLPYHHIVSDEDLLHIKHLYSYKNIGEFTKDLDYLLKHFKPVSADDILDSINKSKQLPSNSFLLSFDDGFKEVYHVIAPLLEAKGVPALFFINPAFVDNKELFYRSKTSLLIDQLQEKKNEQTVLYLFGNEMQIQAPTAEKIIHALKSSKKYTNDTLDMIAAKLGYSFNTYLREQLPFVTSAQLNSLKERGFTIGGHSWDHAYYPALSHDQQVEQTVSSCAYVKAHFDEGRKYFSFPYSDNGLPQHLFDSLSKTDIDLMFGIQNQKEELNNKMVHRFNAERPGVPLSKQLKGILALMAFEKFSNNNKVIRN